ncbi:transcriptional regulator BetI [Rhizobium sp.]
MRLTKLSEIRRRELRQAAMVVLRREGAAGTTLEKVAMQAGASKGIVLHYFRNKQELFEQAMREGNLRLRDRVSARMKSACTPFQRLWAIVSENLGEEAYLAPNGHAWLSLLAEAPREPQLARVQRAIHSRMHSNLMSALTPVMQRADAISLARALSAVIDGFWVRLGLGDNTISSLEARRIAYGMICAALPRDAIEAVDFDSD